MSQPNNGPFGTSTVICPVHGLRYDPATSNGCIRCRRDSARAPSFAGNRPRVPWVAVIVVSVCVMAVIAGAVALRGRASLFANAANRETRSAVPVPDDAAVPEPLPSEGAEGIALGEARTHLDNYEIQAAERILTNLLRDNPTSARVHAFLARAAYRSGQRRDGTCEASAVALAEKELAKADALDPHLPDSTLARAFLLVYAGHEKQARDLCLTMERQGQLPLRASLLIAQLDVIDGDFEDAERRATALIHAIREGFLVDRSYDVLDDVYRDRGDEGAQRALHQIVLGRHGHDGRGRPL